MELAQARKARIVPRTGGRALADALVAQGIDHAFAVPGESYLDVLDGLYDVRQKLKLVTCRFEAGAVNMAEAFGKLTGRPAAAFVTRGPGACHGSIGVHVAMQDSTPMLLFVGQIPHEDSGRDAFQEVDYRQMFSPLAKWVTQIDQAKRIPEIVAHAMDVAVSGRPGPVVIALSEEMQKDMIEVPDLPRATISPPHPDPAAMAQLRMMLSRASKPLAVLGGSCWTDAGRAAIRDFLLGNDVPVTVGFRRQALYDGTLDNFAGDLGVGSDPGLISKAKEADLILAIGYFFADGGFAIVGPYAAEVWPSHLRTSGMGSAYGFGGIGKIIGPVGLALIVGSGNYLKPDVPLPEIPLAFIYLGCWFLMAGAVYYFLGIETRGKSIEEIDRELAAGAGMAQAATPAVRQA